MSERRTGSDVDEEQTSLCFMTTAAAAAAAAEVHSRLSLQWRWRRRGGGGGDSKMGRESCREKPSSCFSCVLIICIFGVIVRAGFGCSSSAGWGGGVQKQFLISRAESQTRKLWDFCWWCRWAINRLLFLPLPFWPHFCFSPVFPLCHRDDLVMAMAMMVSDECPAMRAQHPGKLWP